MRIETVVNVPCDLGCNARIHNLSELQARARGCSQRILETERAGALCQTLLAATGITNKSLRALMAGLLHTSYTPVR
jgi:hypothetical protein